MPGLQRRNVRQNFDVAMYIKTIDRKRLMGKDINLIITLIKVHAALPVNEPSMHTKA